MQHSRSILQSALALILVIGAASAAAQVPPTQRVRAAAKTAPVAQGLPAPSQLTAVFFTGGVQLAWTAVPNSYEYLIFRAPLGREPVADDLIGVLPARNVQAGQGGGYFDRGQVAAAEYRVLAQTVNGQRGAKASATYVPPPSKFDQPVGKKP